MCDTIKKDLHKLRNHYLGKLKIINETMANENTSKQEEKSLLAKKAFCEQQIDLIKKNCLKIGNVTFQKSIVESLKGLFYNKDIDLDSTWYLVGFNDGVYDLRTSTFRDYVPEDYMSMTVGYNYSKVLEANDSELTKMIEQIHPDEESRNCYLSVIATSLEGKTLEKINVFNGDGRNGKGLLDELLRVTLGEYAITMNPAVLCAPLITQGPNPEMAKLHKKRLVIVSELPAGSRINNSLAKTLTGGDNISARFCHSNETQVNLQCTLIIECNKKPPFRDSCTNAEIARLIDLLFPCEFTEDENKVNPSDLKFLANTEYKTKEFKQEHKYTMMKILLGAYKQTKGKVIVPESVKQRGLLYAELSHWALNWFNDNYILVTDPSKREYVPVQNLFLELKDTDIYKNLTKAEKRDFKKDTLVHLFSNSVLYSKHYRERYQP